MCCYFDVRAGARSLFRSFALLFPFQFHPRSWISISKFCNRKFRVWIVSRSKVNISKQQQQNPVFMCVADSSKNIYFPFLFLAGSALTLLNINDFYRAHLKLHRISILFHFQMFSFILYFFYLFVSTSSALCMFFFFIWFGNLNFANNTTLQHQPTHSLILPIWIQWIRFVCVCFTFFLFLLFLLSKCAIIQTLSYTYRISGQLFSKQFKNNSAGSEHWFANITSDSSFKRATQSVRLAKR